MNLQHNLRQSWLVSWLALSAVVSACEKETDKKYYNLSPNRGETLRLEGGEGGALAKNSVFVDLSTGVQCPIERTAWHIALHCGQEFGVRLNPTIGSRALPAPAGIGVQTPLSEQERDRFLALLTPTMGQGDFTTADRIDSETKPEGCVIQKENVYIYCSTEAEKEIYKVSVSQSTPGSYHISYALWNESEVKKVELTKRSDHHFWGFNFAKHQQVEMQPPKDEWDIVWGRSIYRWPELPEVPFMFSDLVFLNAKSGVKAQEVGINDSINYKTFTAVQAQQIILSQAVDLVGSRWRNGGTPTLGPSVKNDRFYLIKDAQGNLYKLRFVSMNEGSDGGKRGYPEICFELLLSAKAPLQEWKY